MNAFQHLFPDEFANPDDTWLFSFCLPNSVVSDDDFLPSYEAFGASESVQDHSLDASLERCSLLASDIDYPSDKDFEHHHVDAISADRNPWFPNQKATAQQPLVGTWQISDFSTISSNTISAANTSSVDSGMGPSSPPFDDQLLENPASTLTVVQYSHLQQPKRKSTSPRVNLEKTRAKRKARALAFRSDVMKTDTSPKMLLRRDVHGKIAGAMTVFGLGQIVRAPSSNEKRLSTWITRRVGACEKCRITRQRCERTEDMYQACDRCKRLAFNFHMGNGSNLKKHRPCLQIGIQDLFLHRKGPTIYDDLFYWVESKQELLMYENFNSTLTLYLTQGFGEEHKNALILTVSRFEPQIGDRTTYFWTDSNGHSRSLEMPPYFISDLDAARRSICQFVLNTRLIYVKTSLLHSNPIIRETFQTALAFSDKSKLISNALDFWVAERLIEDHWRVFWGWESLGLEPAKEDGHPYKGFLPVTPIMDTQLDDLIIRDLLIPLAAQFLKRLEDKIQQQRREDWLEIYLAIFVVMSNFGWILNDMMRIANWKGLKPGARGGTLTQGYMHACKTMLAYFHFACAGSFPLSIPLEQLNCNLKRHGDMELEQIEYIKFVKQEIQRQALKISNWSDLSMYHDNGYWCYQMLCGDWRGDIPHAGEIDDFTENDFLSSSGT